jgi:hypothetical protein
MRLFGMAQDQARAVIDELSTLGIGDAVTESNGNITLTNRRLFRAFKEQESNKHRQSRWRDAQKPSPDVQANNGQITEMSQTSHISLNSSSPKKEIDKKEEEKKNTSSPEILRVFSYWQTRLGHQSAKLTPERIRFIKGRLKDGYSLEELESAIDGCKNSPYHMGQNDHGKVYDGIDLIFRNGSKVEQFIGYNKTIPKARPFDPGATVQKPTIVQCTKCQDVGEIRVDDPEAQFGIRWERCDCKFSEAA